MTRFEWAYPSGVEDLGNQWISGSTMILATVTMNMMYLTVETRMQMGEAGINDPNNKLLVTMLTFGMLFGLQYCGVIDPSNSALTSDSGSHSATSDPNAPLPGVCSTIDNWRLGSLLFCLVTTSCFGFVIFATSQALLSELVKVLTCGRISIEEDFYPRYQRLLAKSILFVVACAGTMLIVVFFAVVPLWTADVTRLEHCAN